MEQHNIKCRLQEWLDAAGLNYSTLAKESGVSILSVRALAKNQFARVDCTTWVALCRYFEQPIEALFYQEEEE